MVMSFEYETNLVLNEQLMNRFTPVRSIDIKAITSILILTAPLVVHRNLHTATRLCIANQEMMNIDEFMGRFRTL